MKHATKHFRLNKELSIGIYNACMDAGFTDCGIISIEDMEDYISRVRERIENVPSSARFYQNPCYKRINETYPTIKMKPDQEVGEAGGKSPQSV